MLQGVALNREPFCFIQQVAWNIVACNVALCMLGLRNILSIRPSQTRRQLTRSVKTSNTTSDTQQMKDHLLNLPNQGSFLANAQDNNQALWSKVNSTLPEQTFKFILNASLDTLPTNHNLFLWKKRPSPICSLCNNNLSYVY